MVWYCLDLRPESKGAKFLSNKWISILVAVVQLVLGVSALFSLMVKPSQTANLHAAEVAFAVFFGIACVGFSVLLLIGLIKDRIGYIKAYLIFLFTIIVVTIITMIINLFTQPQRYGVLGFISYILGILLYILFFFVIRNYFLSKTSRQSGNGV